MHRERGHRKPPDSPYRFKPSPIPSIICIGLLIGALIFFHFIYHTGNTYNYIH
jgi:hypothetical protein